MPRCAEGETLSARPLPCRIVPTCGRSSLPASQLVQLATLPFVGPVIRLWARQRGEATLLPIAGGPLGAGFGFRVAGGGLRGWPASRRQCQHVHFDGAFGNGDADALPDAHDVCGLHAFAIQLDLAAADGIRCQRARLEQTHMPQPFVDAVPVGIGVGCHDVRIKPVSRRRGAFPASSLRRYREQHQESLAIRRDVELPSQVPLLKARDGQRHRWSTGLRFAGQRQLHAEHVSVLVVVQRLSIRRPERTTSTPPRELVSLARYPVWSPDGKTLYYDQNG